MPQASPSKVPVHRGLIHRLFYVPSTQSVLTFSEQNHVPCLCVCLYGPVQPRTSHPIFFMQPWTAGVRLEGDLSQGVIIRAAEDVAKQGQPLRQIIFRKSAQSLHAFRKSMSVCLCQNRFVRVGAVHKGVLFFEDLTQASHLEGVYSFLLRGG